MRTSWKIGRFAGIDLFVHPTFLLLVSFVGLWLGGPSAVLLFLLIFGCVVLHEYGHALTARQFGIATESITLYPIGGVARLKRLPKSPGAEILVSLAGPAVNAVIACVLAALIVWLSGFTAITKSSSLLIPFLWNLLAANVILGLFNMIPAFPMDGGRVLRAALSGWLGRVRATEIAATIGRSLAIIFGALILVSILLHFSPGMLPIRLTQLAMVAFLYTAAGNELASVRLEQTTRRRVAQQPPSGAAPAPSGYQWIEQADGVWRLSPSPIVTLLNSNVERNTSRWL